MKYLLGLWFIGWMINIIHAIITGDWDNNLI